MSRLPTRQGEEPFYRLVESSRVHAVIETQHEQDAETVRPLRLWLVWLLWLVSCIWLNQTNRINQRNQSNQPVLALHAPRPVAHGKRRVSARRGRAGEKTDVFSIRLEEFRFGQVQDLAGCVP